MNPSGTKEQKKNEVVTFGCRLNIYESQIIRQNLEKSGEQGYTVINTCSVTQSAIKKSQRAIRTIKKKDPHTKIIVTGCAAQINPEIFANMPEVSRVFGNQEKLQESSYKADVEEKVLVNDIMSVKETANHLVSHFDSTTRAFIQIQNGCNHRCTFCTIPYARGNNRSVEPSVIINQIKHLVGLGYKEVVLTGVDITDYGTDFADRITLGRLSSEILSKEAGLERLRLSSIDVAEVDEELLELIKYHPRLMPHLHISMQSGDNMILKRMKRRHNREQVINFCQSIRKVRKQIAFGADIIAGFPTETDQMFENTKNLVMEANLQYLHVFPYSAHPNTPASKMPQVQSSVIKERAKMLTDIGAKQLNNFLTDCLGKYGKILVEKDNVGHTENFISVKIDNGPIKPGTMILALLEKVQSGQMIACKI